MKKIVVANWKMNPASLKEAEIIFNKISSKSKLSKSEIIVCPPFVYLNRLKKISKDIPLGAQNVFFEEGGAFTGEISASMLSDLGVKYVILGHSERRALGETNYEINKKIKIVLFLGLKPIVCIGEEERDENHEYINSLKEQITECLGGINKELISKIIIAYEPVWAISTSANHKNATPFDSNEMVIFIKKTLHDKFGSKTKMPRIIYGGSVNEKNCRDFLTDGGVEGLLVGNASLNPDKFLEIIKITDEI